MLSLNSIYEQYNETTTQLNHTAIQVKGQDAEKFLHGQLTINVESLNPGQSQLACHLNPKGRIISLFHCYCFDKETYYLVMNDSIAQCALNALKKYAMFSKVEIILANLNVYGAIAVDTHLERNHVCFHPWDDNNLTFIVTDAVLKTSNQVDPSLWHAISLFYHTPYLTETSSESIIPLWLELDKQAALDFKKGCYTGQEIIARMHFRNKRGKKVSLSNEATQKSIDHVSINNQTIALDLIKAN